MKRKIKKWLALVAVTIGILSCGTMTAFAYTDEAAQTEDSQTEVVLDEQPVETEAPVLDEQPAETEGNSFSVPGNGQLVDDIENDGTKQFLTIQTKNGNTFFMVLDRSSNTDNVYMLSMIDENDLAEFIEDTKAKEPETEAPQVVLPEKETTPAETEAIETPTEQEGTNMGAMLAIVVLLVGAIGGFYYVKVVKPKKAEEGAEEEDLEFYDGGKYINEDQADVSDHEEDE